jgi:hypothetical protein
MASASASASASAAASASIVLAAQPAFKQIRLATTDLAVVCGMDHYGRLPNVICKLWKQIDRNGYDQIVAEMREAGHMIANDSIYSKIAHYDHKTRKQASVLNRVKALNQRRETHSAALVAGQEAIHKIIDDKLHYHMKPEDREHLKSLVTSAANTQYGTRTESRGLDIFKREIGKELISAQKLNKWLIYQDNSRYQQWLITGKVDGITADGEVLEIKNRQKCLFNVMRDYEMAQVQCYLNNMPSPRGYLLEIFKATQDSDSTYKIHPIERDEVYYNTHIKAYIPRLVEFMNRLVFSDYFSKEFKWAAVGGDRSGDVNKVFNHSPEFNDILPNPAVAGLVTNFVAN